MNVLLIWRARQLQTLVRQHTGGPVWGLPASSGSVPVLPKHHLNAVRVANGEIADSVRTGPNRNCYGGASTGDLGVERVHIPDPEKDANARWRVLALGQM